MFTHNKKIEFAEPKLSTTATMDEAKHLDEIVFVRSKGCKPSIIGRVKNKLKHWFFCMTKYATPLNKEKVVIDNTFSDVTYYHR